MLRHLFTGRGVTSPNSEKLTAELLDEAKDPIRLLICVILLPPDYFFKPREVPTSPEDRYAELGGGGKVVEQEQEAEDQCCETTTPAAFDNDEYSLGLCRVDEFVEIAPRKYPGETLDRRPLGGEPIL
ncbi:hypothetical protein FRB98_009574 [Tulasnella sp. 332]|nr:hypothetical protein FRB98_009574 [Tulasnella sp. 332]